MRGGGGAGAFQTTSLFIRETGVSVANQFTETMQQILQREVFMSHCAATFTNFYKKSVQEETKKTQKAYTNYKYYTLPR